MPGWNLYMHFYWFWALKINNVWKAKIVFAWANTWISFSMDCLYLPSKHQSFLSRPKPIVKCIKIFNIMVDTEPYSLSESEFIVYWATTYERPLNDTHNTIFRKQCKEVLYIQAAYKANKLCSYVTCCRIKA